MRNLIRNTILLFLLCSTAFTQIANAQSIIDPSDPVITYDPNNPPVQPVYGQIGKWVRTVRMTWNTDMYKAYIYKGMAFRLHFPKSYAPGVNDGKKYPVMVFFHGHGEYGPIYDNEFHLLHGHQTFDNAINNGTFDGYVISPQSTGYFGLPDYARVIEVIEYMIANNKVDPFQITVNGLSQGGQACWEMLYNYPTYVSAISPMSWSSTNYTTSDFVNKVKYTPIWVFQGGKDVNPAPSTTYQVRDAMLSAGGNFKLTVYPDLGHGTWYSAWAERDFWPYTKRAYSANPWQVGGKIDYWPGDPINATLGLPAAFGAYEWRKDGVLISSATSNTLNVTQVGVYDARVQRNGIWSDWSRIPVAIKVKTFIALPGRVQAESWAAMGGTQKEYGVQNESTSDAGGGQNVGWIDQGDWMDYNVNPSSSGTYTVNLRIATPNTGGQLQIKNQAGTVLTTVNLPNTGAWQTYQTISTTLNLTAGNQIIRVESSAAAMWNFNWMDFISGGTPTNQLPVANAGADKAITLPTNSVNLLGSATDADGSIVSYAWSQVSGPSSAIISAPSSASTTVGSLAQGTYTFRLTVSDNAGATASDDVIVTVNPAPASSFGKIEAENWSNMSGVRTENTSDVGGGLNVGWIDQGDWMEYSINPPSSGGYTLNLRIATPNNGGQLQVRKADGTTLATVNVPNTGAYQTWQTTSTTVSLTAGVQTIRLVSTATPIWNINWLEFVQSGTTNQPPTANAGADQTIMLPTNSVGLSGSGSDPDGSIASYAWTKVSGPAGESIGSPSSASTTVSGLVQGTYTFRLTVTDNVGAATSDDVLVTVNPAPVVNQPPTANAGTDQTITLPTNSVGLSGSGSDADGSIASYAWTKVSGPAGESIGSPSSASTTVSGLVQGTYTFRLTVTDNAAATATDDVIVTVNPAPVPSFSLKIEAESYTAMNGITTQSTQDGGAAIICVTGINDNDWMDYSVNVPYSGSYTVNFRLATTKGGTKFQLRKADGTVLTTISAPNTGGVQKWQTVSAAITLAQGQQTLRIYASKVPGILNINWWELILTTATATRINSAQRQLAAQEHPDNSVLKLYPSPVRDQLVIEVNNAYSGEMTVRLISMNGGTVKQVSIDKKTGKTSLTVPVSDLPKGEYLVSVQMKEEKQTRRILKM